MLFSVQRIKDMNKIISRSMVIGALGEGLYLLLKYGLIVILVLTSLYFYNNLSSKADNGNQAAIAINEYIKNGYLPSFPLKPREK